jgi:hypothetical protein
MKTCSGALSIVTGVALMTLACNGAVAPADVETGVSQEGVQLAGAKAPKSAVSTPTLTAVDASGASITLRVCAGATGAAAGFSIQWMSPSEWDAAGGTWPSEYDGTNYCKASFSGAPKESEFNLTSPIGANQCANVVIGGLDLDAVGVSSSCDPGDLQCGMLYHFRGFAHASSTYQRSAWAFATGSTDACVPIDAGCTYTQGYWKTPGGGDQLHTWPVDGLTIGGFYRDKAALLVILGTAVKGDATLILEHQLIAAMLNVANGASAPASVVVGIATANAMLADGFVSASEKTQAIAIATMLDSFNNGDIGPGHCQ